MLFYLYIKCPQLASMLNLFDTEIKLMNERMNESGPGSQSEHFARAPPHFAVTNMLDICC